MTDVGRIGLGRLLERLCFLFPPVVGVGLVGVLEDLDPAVPGLGIALLLLGSLGYAALTVALTVTIVIDARAVAAAGVWRPSPWRYGVAGLVLAPAAGPVYLSRRYRRLGVPSAWDGWWVAIAASLLTGVGGIAGAVIGATLEVPELAVTSLGVAGAVAVGAFPVAIHQDAAHLSTADVDWTPNPGSYLGLAFACLLVPPLQLGLAAVYLERRRRAVGLPVPSWPLAR